MAKRKVKRNDNNIVIQKMKNLFAPTEEYRNGSK